MKEYPEDPDRADRQKYIDFKEAVEAAEADGEARLLQKLQDASEEPRNWTAAAWILERKYRDKWSRNDRSEINVTGTINHKVDVRQKINDQLARISTRQDEGGGSVKPEGGGGD